MRENIVSWRLLGVMLVLSVLWACQIEEATSITPASDATEAEDNMAAIADVAPVYNEGGGQDVIPVKQQGLSCPASLAECYAGFSAGSECQSGQLLVRFTHGSVGGNNVCTEPGDLNGQLAGCVFYGDPIATVSYCCNGYIANRSNWIVDAHQPECCAIGLDAEYGKADHSTMLDTQGTHNPGLSVPEQFLEAKAEDYVCVEWYWNSGATSAEYLYEHEGVHLLYFPATLEQDVSGNKVLYCNYQQTLSDSGQQTPAILGLAPGSTWTLPSGEDCNDLQEGIY